MKKLLKTESLVLRCCAADMTSHDGFKWPGVGETVTAPDWVDDTKCGNGLHGWRHGRGDHSTTEYWRNADAKWLVVRVRDSIIRDLAGKCKFPTGVIEFVGSMGDAARFILTYDPRAKSGSIIGEMATGESVVVAQLGTATAGNDGTATAGNDGTATAGYRGTATAGNGGTATAGNDGTATAGNGGILVLRYHDGPRYRVKVAHVGEGGIEPNVPYCLDVSGEFVKKEIFK